MATKTGRIRLSLEGIELALSRGGTPEARQEFLESLRERVSHFERQYRLPSSMLREALRSNKMPENLDVVKWNHAYETLKHLENGTEARLERTPKLPRSRAASAP